VVNFNFNFNFNFHFNLSQFNFNLNFNFTLLRSPEYSAPSARQESPTVENSEYSPEYSAPRIFARIFGTERPPGISNR